MQTDANDANYNRSPNVISKHNLTLISKGNARRFRAKILCFSPFSMQLCGKLRENVQPYAENSVEVSAERKTGCPFHRGSPRLSKPRRVLLRSSKIKLNLFSGTTCA